MDRRENYLFKFFKFYLYNVFFFNWWILVIKVVVFFNGSFLVKIVKVCRVLFGSCCLFVFWYLCINSIILFFLWLLFLVIYVINLVKGIFWIVLKVLVSLWVSIILCLLLSIFNIFCSDL